MLPKKWPATEIKKKKEKESTKTTRHNGKSLSTTKPSRNQSKNPSPFQKKHVQMSTNTESTIQSIYPKKLRWKFFCWLAFFQVPLSCSHGCISETIHALRGLRFSGTSSWCHYGLGGWATSSTSTTTGTSKSTGLPGKIEVDFWEGWEKKVGFELGEIGRSLFLTDVNNVRKMVDVTFGAVLCKVAPSTSLSQSMLGCRAGMLGLPEFSGFIWIFLANSPSNWYLRSDIILCKKL